MYNGGQYRLLFVSKDDYVNDDGTTSPGCAHCAHFAREYEPALIAAIQAGNRVNYSHIPYVSANGKLIPLPQNQGGARAVHPQLISYILGFPSFILVNDANFYSRNALEVRVFNRIVRDGKYVMDSSQPYSPTNIAKWVNTQMDEIDQHIKPQQYQTPLIKDETLYAAQRRKYRPGFSE